MRLPRVSDGPCVRCLGCGLLWALGWLASPICVAAAGPRAYWRAGCQCSGSALFVTESAA
jgi:hypothetical protein